MKSAISSRLLWIAVLALCVGQTPDCRAAPSGGDYLVPVKKAIGSRVAYEELWRQKLLVTPGEVARFIGLPGTLGVETTISVYRAPGKEGSLPGDCWVTATQASERLWNLIEPDAKGQVDPDTVAIQRCDAPIAESTALAMHNSWLTMLSLSRPQRNSREISLDNSREIFSTVDSDGNVLQGESSTTPKENTKALISIAFSSLEYCGADAAVRASMATDIEKAASDLLGRVALKNGNDSGARNHKKSRDRTQKAEASGRLAPVIGTLALISSAAERLSGVVAEAEFTPVRVLGREGMIVPQAYLRESGLPAEGFWTPKASQLKEVERSLPAFLRKQMQSRPLGELSEVIALEPKYRRQYVGMILNGRKVIWVNCLPQESEKGVDPFANWNRQVIDVSDGGSDFWGVVYDVERHSFDRLILNGSA